MEQILLLEDEASLRDDLSEYLATKGYAVFAAASFAEGRSMLNLNRFDAAILDIGLPDGDGFGILAEIRATDPNCAVMMLTAYAEPEARVKGLDNGADAYLVKRATLREIDATLRSILRRRAPVSEAKPLSTRGWTLDPTEWRLIAPNGEAARLSSSEFAFFAALSEHNGTVCPREHILKTIDRIGSPRDSLRNLEALVRRLRRKITDGTGLEAPVRMVYGTGYILTAPFQSMSRH